MNGETQEKPPRKFSPVPRLRFLWALSVALALSGGAIYDRWVLLQGVPPGAESQFQMIAQAWGLIQRYYVGRDALRPTALAHAAVQGMVESLGDTGHTAFLSPQENRFADRSIEPNFTGIGVEIKMSTNHQPVIVAALDGSPALRAGLRGGDIIMEVNDQSIAGLPLSETEERIRGKEGEPVTLGVLVPPNGDHKHFTVKRASIKIANVTWRELPGTRIAHLRIAMFNEGVTPDFRNALVEIQHKGCTGLILDLRNNPGGVLDEAIGVASQLLDGGNVLLERNAEGKLKPQHVRPGGVATNIPLVVLINGGSASASEIVAGALVDAHRATLIGEKTFGTGTVLQKYPLPDGSALLLAVDEWLTPSGHSFWHTGIKPDEQVALPRDTLPLLPAAESALTPETFQASGDAQLLRAVAILSAAPPIRN